MTCVVSGSVFALFQYLKVVNCLIPSHEACLELCVMGKVCESGIVQSGESRGSVS